MAIRFNLAEERPVISRLLKKYATVPISLANACLVRLAEQHIASPILTLDSHFRIYRKSGRAIIPTIMPK